MILAGTALSLHFGSYFLKPLVSQEKKVEDVNAQIRQKIEKNL